LVNSQIGKYIPFKGVAKLINLEYLKIHYNTFEKIPDLIFNMKKIDKTGNTLFFTRQILRRSYRKN